ncbi:MAG: CoB--CoM heterodisulfide reductase iron-sulfur subunit A family protein [Rhodospirillales bacterium]|nr:CoB--CoM heterodisulfide reductase iron-sulfur subunit A family protein [Rhodospirillales bacterium]
MSNGKLSSRTILVVGGGIAGISATVEAAEAGYEVVLVESSPTLGGRVAQLNRYFPKLCQPTCGLEINYQRIKKNRAIKVYTMTSVGKVEGETGNFTVSLNTRPRFVKANCTACGDCAGAAESEIDNPFNYGMDKTKAAYLPHAMAFPLRYVIDPSVIGSPEAEKIKASCTVDAVDLEDKEGSFEIGVGAIIWATGWQPYGAEKITQYGYGEVADVINNVEMERLAAMNGPTAGRIVRPSDGKEAKRVAFIQCAGSRDEKHLPYCSRICCLGSLKHAAYLREQYADAEIDIYYIDIRAHDKLEGFYQKLKNDPQVNFIKSKPGSIVRGESGDPTVKGENTITREIYANSYDLVVLATGMEPSARGEGSSVNLQRDEYGFVVPCVFEPDGMIAAGVASGPLDVSMSVQSATAAALRAIQAIAQGEGK